MLTIKHYVSEANESVIEARSTHFSHTENESPKLIAFGSTVDYCAGVDGTAADEPKQEPNHHDRTVVFGNGLVFVMNASGSTIAKYDLDAIAEQWRGAKAHKSAQSALNPEQVASNYERVSQGIAEATEATEAAKAVLSTRPLPPAEAAKAVLSTRPLPPAEAAAAAAAAIETSMASGMTYEEAVRTKLPDAAGIPTEYSGMSYEQASREALRLVKRVGWFKSFDRLKVLQERMVLTHPSKGVNGWPKDD